MTYHSLYKICLILCSGFVFALSVNGQTTFIIKEYPQNTPIKDHIYMSGDFEGWTGGQQIFQLKKDKGLYSISFPKSDKTIHYKFTRGSWNSVEVSKNGKQIDNRAYSFLEARDSVFIQVENWDDLSPNPNTISTNVHLIDNSFKMETLDKERTIYIYLPANYKNTTQSYPVLYMHDGQNLFDQSRSYSGEWEVDETLDKLSESKDLNLIVVAIDHGAHERLDEYSPWKLKDYPSKQEGDAYLKFIIQNLKPYIDQNYRTLSDRTNTGIMGSSLGGLISYYGVLQYADTFGKAGIFSPSFEVADISSDFIKDHSDLNRTRMYFMAGNKESKHMKGNMLKTIQLMNEAGFPEKNIKSKVVEEGEHNEKLWREEFPAAIEWLFKYE